MRKRETELDKTRKWAEECAKAAKSAAADAAESHRLFDDVILTVSVAAGKLDARIDTLRDDHDDTRKLVLALAVKANLQAARLDKLDPPPPVVMFCPVCRDVELTRGAECNGVTNYTCPKCGKWVVIHDAQPDKAE